MIPVVVIRLGFVTFALVATAGTRAQVLHVGGLNGIYIFEMLDLYSLSILQPFFKRKAISVVTFTKTYIYIIQSNLALEFIRLRLSRLLRVIN